MLLILLTSIVWQWAWLWDRTWMSHLVRYRLLGCILQSLIDSWSIFNFLGCSSILLFLYFWCSYKKTYKIQLLYSWLLPAPIIVHVSLSTTVPSALNFWCVGIGICALDEWLHSMNLWFTCALCSAHQCFLYTRIRLITKRWNKQV